MKKCFLWMNFIFISFSFSGCSSLFWEQYAANLSAAMPGVLEQIEANNAMAAQQKAEKEKQWAAELASQRQQAQQRAQALNQQNVQVTSSMSVQQNSSSYNSQEDISDLFTSDPTWNRQVQLWAHQYGSAKAREMAILHMESSRSQSNSRTVSIESTERVISAITASRQQINIKVRGNLVVAYNEGGYSNSNVLEQKWENLIPVASIQKTSERNDLDSRLKAEFTHTAEIGSTRIYFNL